MSWHQVPNPSDWLAAWRNQFGDVPAPRAFENGRLRALVGREPLLDGDWRWHISLTGPGRVPTWEELAACAHELRPGVPFAVGVPPRSWWMNVHDHCLHLWELKDEAILAEWRRNRMGHTPS